MTTVTDDLVARGASRVALRSAALDKALWHMVHRAGYFRRRLVPTPRPGYGGAFPAHTWETKLLSRSPRDGALREVGGVAEGTLRTMNRCGLVRRRRGEDDGPERHYLLTDLGRRMAEEHRAEGRNPVWRDRDVVDARGAAVTTVGFEQERWDSDSDLRYAV